MKSLVTLDDVEAISIGAGILGTGGGGGGRVRAQIVRVERLLPVRRAEVDDARASGFL